MSNSLPLFIYGSYGYTGRLIVDECAAKKIPVLLGGRDESQLKRQHAASGYPYRVVDLNDAVQLRQVLKGACAVVHAAGPFRYTARPMVEACIETGTHYIDITGEFQVFEQLAHYHEAALKKNIQILPGAGFDVVPTDCLALHLKKRLPDATHLQLAFAASRGGVSRGTAKTMVEGAGTGSWVRKEGRLQPVPLGKLTLPVDFGKGETLCLNIPWGDISTAWRTTGIPNIEVYTAVKPSMIRNARWSNAIGWMLQWRWVKRFIQKQIDRRPAGPDAAQRAKGRSFIWGKVWNAAGQSRTGRLETPDGYTLTAKTCVAIAAKVRHGNFRPGYQTPAAAYGEAFVLEIDHTTLTDALNAAAICDTPGWLIVSVNSLSCPVLNRWIEFLCSSCLTLSRQ